MKADEELFFSKRVSGEIDSYYNTEPKEDKYQKGNLILNKFRYC